MRKKNDMLCGLTITNTYSIYLFKDGREEIGVVVGAHSLEDGREPL